MSKRYYIRRTPDTNEVADSWNVYDRDTPNDLNDSGHDCVESYVAYEYAVEKCQRLNSAPGVEAR